MQFAPPITTFGQSLDTACENQLLCFRFSHRIISYQDSLYRLMSCHPIPLRDHGVRFTAVTRYQKMRWSMPHISFHALQLQSLRTQYPSIKECTLNYRGLNIFLNLRELGIYCISLQAEVPCKTNWSTWRRACAARASASK